MTRSPCFVPVETSVGERTQSKAVEVKTSVFRTCQSVRQGTRSGRASSCQVLESPEFHAVLLFLRLYSSLNNQQMRMLKLDNSKGFERFWGCSTLFSQGDRDRQTDTYRDRRRQTQTDRDIQRERERERETEVDTHTQTD